MKESPVPDSPEHEVTLHSSLYRAKIPAFRLDDAQLATLSCLTRGHLSLYHNKYVYHSIKESHLGNLYCLLNCPFELYEWLVLGVAISLAHRRFSRRYSSGYALGDDLDHFHNNLSQFVVRCVDKLLLGLLRRQFLRRSL